MSPRSLSRILTVAAALAGPLGPSALVAEHLDPVYVDAPAAGWQPTYWDCAGSQMQQCSSLAQGAVVHGGAAALEVDHCCPAGWGAFGLDRRTPDWTAIHSMYPNQYRELRLFFNPGPSLAGIDSLHLTLDTGTSAPITDFIAGPLVANAWVAVVVPLSALDPDGSPFFRVYFQNLSSEHPAYYVDDVVLAWVDDAIPPAISAVSVSEVTDGEARISWTTDEHTKGTLGYGVGSPSASVAETDYTLDHSVLLSGLAPATTYSFRVTARDHQEDPAAAANVAVHEATFTTAPPDTTPPVISQVTVAETTASRAKVCWTTDEPASSEVGYGLSGYTAMASDPARVEQRCVVVTGLEPSRTYQFRVRSADRSGNTATYQTSPPLAFSTEAPVAASLTVDAAQAIRPFSDGVRGAAIGNWTYYWARPYPGHSAKLVELAKLIRPGVLRHAGGLASNQVRWDRGNEQCYPGEIQGGSWCDRRPYETWKAGIDTCSTPSRPVAEAYGYGYQADEIDAVAAFAATVGAEVMIEVDVTTCDPAMWADMLHYTNVEHDYGFRYWELGNELDLELVSGASDIPVGAEYVDRFKRYARALKAVDPSVSIVGPSTAAHEEDGFFNPMSRYVDPLTLDPEVVAEQMLDVLSYHHYPLWNHAGGIVTREDMFAWSDADATRSREHVDHCAADKRALLDERGHPNAKIAVTEFNAIAATVPTSLAFNHAQALYMADTLPRQAAAGADVVIHWELYDQPYDAASQSVVTSYGLINHNGSTASRDASGALVVDDRYGVTPTYYTYFMLAQLFGDLLVSAESSRPESLSIWASTDGDDPETLKLIVVNLDPDAVAATLDVAGFAPASARAYTLANPAFSSAADPATVFDGSSINGLVLDTSSPQAIASSAAAILAGGTAVPVDGSRLSLLLPGYSATSVVLSAAEVLFRDGFESGGVGSWSAAVP